jgi:hypothetical protein
MMPDDAIRIVHDRDRTDALVDEHIDDLADGRIFVDGGRICAHEVGEVPLLGRLGHPIDVCVLDQCLHERSEVAIADMPTRTLRSSTTGRWRTCIVWSASTATCGVGRFTCRSTLRRSRSTS